MSPRVRSYLWVLGAAVFGLAMRLLFGALPGDANGAMSIGFLIGVPMAMGALTALGAPTRPPGWVHSLLMPWLTTSLAMLGCALAKQEGTICLVIMLPLFLGFSSLGGAAMAIAMRLRNTSRSRLSSVAALPLLLLLAEQALPLQQRELELRRSVMVAAPPSEIWRQILSAKAIRPEELPPSFVHAIGVPRPVEGVNVLTPEGEVRYSTWERGVHFRALVAAREDERSIRWLYRFDPDSFPPGTMDEHVAIGGRYFKLRDTTFNLRPQPDGRTELEIVAHCTVASTVNFYAVPAAEWMGRDFVDTILGLYKGRSERAVAAGDRGSH